MKNGPKAAMLCTRLMVPAGLTPGKEDTQFSELITQSGSDLAQSRWVLEFTEWLKATGFGHDDVRLILEAAEHT